LDSWGLHWRFRLPNPVRPGKVLHNWRTTGFEVGARPKTSNYLDKLLISLGFLKITVQILGHFFIPEFAKASKDQSSSQSYPQIGTPTRTGRASF
jgi:hypothetical protein